MHIAGLTAATAPRPISTSFAGSGLAGSGRLDQLLALERVGTRHAFPRNAEIYIEGDRCDHWYRIVSGTVRVCKLLADGRRHIAEFWFSGDCFGLENAPARSFAAEAVEDVVVMRYPRAATERVIEETPGLGRWLREIMLHDLATARERMLLLGRKSAPERVASFLLELFDRKDGAKAVELAMSRNDIADYLGLTIETVCRVLSSLKRHGAIAIPSPHRIELRNREAIEALIED